MSNADLIKRGRKASEILQKGALKSDAHDAAMLNADAELFDELADALEAADKRIADLADQLAHCQTSRQKAREEVLRVLDKRLAGKDQGK